MTNVRVRVLLNHRVEIDKTIPDHRVAHALAAIRRALLVATAHNPHHQFAVLTDDALSGVTRINLVVGTKRPQR